MSFLRTATSSNKAVRPAPWTTGTFTPAASRSSHPPAA